MKCGGKPGVCLCDVGQNETRQPGMCRSEARIAGMNGNRDAQHGSEKDEAIGNSQNGEKYEQKESCDHRVERCGIPG